ncbi:MAG: 4-hydroxythreonine-4-phosphate dehydrogenase PdxA, partial [Halanaerobiales bacterium]
QKIAGIVTAPIHKEAIKLAGVSEAGHTEILAHKFGVKNYAMMLAEGDFRVVHVSTHVSLKKACEKVKKERIYQVIKLADTTLKKMGVARPKIAVAGLNPHAGENGLFGSEEQQEIIPAVKQALVENIEVEGPISPDTVFAKARTGQYDIVVAMYHDQGHIPMKTVGFKYNNKKDEWLSVSGVNVTLGLPVVRTSVDHGVAFDIAGKNQASSDSMIQAIKLAQTMV